MMLLRYGAPGERRQASKRGRQNWLEQRSSSNQDSTESRETVDVESVGKYPTHLAKVSV